MSYPNIVPCHSPNYRKSKGKRNITCVIIHATATSGLQSPKEWLCDPASQVSAHYLIDVDGTIYQLVDDNDIAWHAGVSEWKGQDNVNNFSIGIELVNANDGKMEYPEEQRTSLCGLVAEICETHNIGASDVVGHLDIAPGRKTDPANFPWDDFRMDLVKLEGSGL